MSEEKMFKVVLKKLPKFFSKKEFKKFVVDTFDLKDVDVNFSFPNNSFRAKMAFAKEGDYTNFINLFKLNSPVLFKKTTILIDSAVKTTKNEETDKKPSTLTENELNEMFNMSIAPLSNTPYPNQLVLKHSTVKNLIQKKLVSFSNKNYKLLQSIPCLQTVEICPVVPSKVLTAYRNKMEFSVGQDQTKSKFVVGFRIGKLKNVDNFVYFTDECVMINEKVKSLVSCCQNIVDTHSLNGEIVGKDRHDIYLKNFSLRCNKSDCFMLVFDIHFHTEIKNSFIEGLAVRVRSDFCEFKYVKSIIFMVYHNNAFSKLVNVYGENFIYESLNETKFRISNSSFFQTNSHSAETLYNTICDLIESRFKTNNNILLDICCGSGTIGLFCGFQRNLFVKCIGVDIVQSSIDDAVTNYNINKEIFANDKKSFICEFHCDDANNFINNKFLSQFEKSKDCSVIAVLDPSRSGLKKEIIYTLRECKLIKYLLYVSCQPTSVMNNLSDLIRPESKTIKGKPFEMSKVVPVDMFPHTNHIECIFEFRREFPLEEGE